MKKESEPFWEKAYRKPEEDTFGSPSEEVRSIVRSLPRSAVVLDAGCGEGRNALFLAELEFDVRAFDVSQAAISKLKVRAAERKIALEAWVADIGDFEFDQNYDLVMTHGVLHLLHPEVCRRFLGSARQHTKPGGFNVHVVFTDAIPPPSDLAPFVHRLFREGELCEMFSDWHVEFFSSYIKNDEHPGSPPHQHPINKLVVRRPETASAL